jgi:anti-sigma-K factor RskA
MTERDDPIDDQDLLAAEYALGVLDPEARRAAQLRLQRDPAFAGEVAAWEARLAPLAEALPEVAPPPELWTRLEKRLEPEPAKAAANDNTPTLRFWRRLALGSTALAAASIAAVVILLARPAPTGPQIATLSSTEGAAAAVIAFDPAHGALVVTPVGGLDQPGHSPHLWLMETGGAVRLVGAIDPHRAATHRVPGELARRARMATGFAISLEPAGRPPVNAPNGPVVASGDFSRL